MRIKILVKKHGKKSNKKNLSVHQTNEKSGDENSIRNGKSPKNYAESIHRTKVFL